VGQSLGRIRTEAARVARLNADAVVVAVGAAIVQRAEDVEADQA